MDARPRRSSLPAAAVSLLLLLSAFSGAEAYAYGEASGSGGMTELQKHAAFFDANNDGVVTFSETYDAFRSFGFGIAASTLSATFINAALCPMTRPENDTSRLSVYIENIHKGIHGSDSGAYDHQGRFVPEKFEAIFAKHAKTVPDALTSAEVDELISANRQPSDYAGWAGASAEWKMLYSIAVAETGGDQQGPWPPPNLEIFSSARTRTGSSARTPLGTSTTAASSPGWCTTGGVPSKTKHDHPAKSFSVNTDRTSPYHL